MCVLQLWPKLEGLSQLSAEFFWRWNRPRWLGWQTRNDLPRNQGQFYVKVCFYSLDCELALGFGVEWKPYSFSQHPEMRHGNLATTKGTWKPRVPGNVPLRKRNPTRCPNIRTHITFASLKCVVKFLFRTSVITSRVHHWRNVILGMDHRDTAAHTRTSAAKVSSNTQSVVKTIIHFSQYFSIHSLNLFYVLSVKSDMGS